MHPVRRLGLAAVLVLASTFTAGAHAAASAASVERLMQVMRVQQQLDTIYTQTLPAMQNAMRQSMAGQLSPADADRLFNAVMPRVDAVIREELGWAKLKPDFAKIYAETFTQQEIDGLIAFYEGPLGSALVEKMPQLTQRSMALMQQRMPAVMQKAMQVAREEAARVQPLSGKKR
jgi:uncharacterized protein